MRSSEWVSFVYFAALTAIAWIRPLPVGRRIPITAIGVVMCAAILTLARNGTSIARDWAPAIVILVGYYLSGRFFCRPSEALERWLMAWDVWLLGDPTTRFARWPRLGLAYLEIVYMGCFLLLPAGFAVLAWAGRADLADRYWTMVVSAEFGAFGPLSIIQSRPPWALERPAALPDRGVHGVALVAVERFSIQANTFPSGHAAGSLAVALAVFAAMPWTGAVFLVLAASISLACIVGRYHYVVDVLAGAALAIVIWLMN
jgi:membrane-associated phospholipid phosphatase